MREQVILKVAKGLAWGALAFAVACHLWAANRGLEMTDESSYLLIALDPWKTWGHGTFHGFLLRPLYLLGGSSVVGLRWIGYVVVLVAAWRLAGAIRIRLGTGHQTLASLATPVLLVATMTVYCGGIRTPCYNWMILVGAILAWAGWLRCGYSRLGPLEMGLGFTFALVGKWGAALSLLVLFTALSLINGRNLTGPGRNEWIKAMLVFTVTTVGFALYAGGKGIKDTLEAGILIAQTTGSHGWFIVPKYGWELFYYLYRMGRAFVWLLPAIFLFWWLVKKNPGKWSTQKVATILFAGGLLLAAVRGWWRGGIEQFGKESVLAGCWLLGVAWTVWAVKRRTEGGGRKSVVGGQWSVGRGRATLLWGLVATPYLCGIGTNTSIADYAGQGTVFFAAAGILMFAIAPVSKMRGVACVALIGLCLIQSSRVSSALLGMYRLGSVFSQTEKVSFGPENQRLMVAPEIREVLEALRSPLQGEGFKSGDPLIGVDSLCGVVYLAGGHSPGMPWYFRDQKDFLERTMRTLPAQTLNKAWLLIRTSSQSARPSEWWPDSLATFPSLVAVWSSQWDGQSEEFRLYRPSRP